MEPWVAAITQSQWATRKATTEVVACFYFRAELLAC